MVEDHTDNIGPVSSYLSWGQLAFYFWPVRIASESNEERRFSAACHYCQSIAKQALLVATTADKGARKINVADTMSFSDSTGINRIKELLSVYDLSLVIPNPH